MEERPAENPPLSRVKKGPNVFIIIVITIVAILTIGLYLFLQKSISNHAGMPSNDSTITGETKLPEQTTSATEDTRQPVTKGQDGQISTQQKKEISSTQVDKPITTETTLPGDSLGKKELLVTSSVPTGASDALNTNQQSINTVNAFYVHLDQQGYLQSFGKQDSSKLYFSRLLQKLADNPPVVVRETDDLFTILQNTAHFFRILGKDNILLLKKILATEHNTFEHPLKALYALTYQPEDLKREYSLTISPKALVDYAAFFLNTMGGRLYLFRRDSTSRLIVSYYAIITIERANIDGRGGHGIDLRPAIFSLIEEMENGGKLLQLKDEYLDTLYDLQEKYN